MEGRCREGRRIDKRRRNEQRVQWACQRRWPQKKSTEDTRLWEDQGCPAWKWKNRMKTHPLKNPCRRGALGRRVNRGPFHAPVIQRFEIWRSTNVGTTEGEDRRRMWHAIFFFHTWEMKGKSVSHLHAIACGNHLTPCRFPTCGNRPSLRGCKESHRPRLLP